MKRDRDRWEKKYAAGAHEERDPERFVVDMLAHAPAGRALDVACGRGRHAIALAQRGWEVDAIDISPAGLASARERAGDLPIRWIEADLDGFEPAGGYAVVVCVDFTDERLAPRLINALAPGGLLVYVARPRGSCSYGPHPGDVERWFGELETVACRESERRIEYAATRTLP